MMNSKKLISEIQNYVHLVCSGKIPVCEEQILVCEYVEQIFEKENLYINEEQLKKYLDLQKYFPFELLEWEIFCFHCIIVCIERTVS